jgi:phosphoadenosine phosphosulfate reductase
MMMTQDDVRRLAAEYEDAPAQDILRFAINRFPRIAISLAGAESSVLVDMAVEIKSDVAVFTLDTGRLHPETYRFIDAIRERFRLDVEVLFPEPLRVEALVREKGLFSFYTDGHEECCAIRKVEPLKRMLQKVDAWITGQRRDQSPTRSMIPVIELDETFGTKDRPLLKFNPLAKWNMQRVWSHIHENRVPYNELYEHGYASIGCEPCTRPVPPGEHERAGRWWWEDPTSKECGIHAGNLVRSKRSA